MLSKSDLREGQQIVATRVYEDDGVLVVVPMGGGKTAAVLTAIKELIQDQEIRCALIIAPKRVSQLVWPREPVLWHHLSSLNLINVTGTPKQRAKKLELDADVYVVGINNIPWLVDQLQELPEDHPLFDMVVIDEISRIRDVTGTWAKKMREIGPRFKQKVGLTGTPRPNGYLDLFGMLSFLTDNRLWGRSFEKWKRANFYPTDYDQRNWTVLPGREEEIRAAAASVSVTIDEMPDLPPYQPEPDQRHRHAKAAR